MTIKTTLSEFTRAMPKYIAQGSVCPPDPDAKSHAGTFPYVGMRVAFCTNTDPIKIGWYWRIAVEAGPWYGPYSTSEAAYDAFHDHMGWVRMDKAQP